MCRVKSFLGCIKLETFGLFIGQLELVLAVAVAIPSILGIVVAVFAASFFGFSVKGEVSMTSELVVNLSVFCRLNIHDCDPDGGSDCLHIRREYEQRTD